MDMFVDKILNGDNRLILKDLPNQSMDMIVCSPPYFNQRDYGVENQIGAEQEPVEYIAELLKVFGECNRLLKSSGTLWVNLGDKYHNGRLLGMPWRVALALQDELTWILRSDIIWHKPNAMPSPISSRPTTDHEYLFMFSKDAKYYFDADSIREPHVTFSENSKMKGGRNHFGKPNGTPEKGKNQGNSNLHNARWDQAFHPKGRNRRTVWQIPLSKFPDAHFAVFPEKLVEICILAGCPENGIVLDPFMGSGTTAMVAKRLGRRYVGVEISEEFCAMARARLAKHQQHLRFG
jgi:DNA modification methylase